MIPEFRSEFIQKNLDKWIDSAITAFFDKQLDQDYIIHDGDIKIVDKENTGIVHERMTWSQGIHQFL